eukprot:2099628-Prymnesium_polylepis.1
MTHEHPRTHKSSDGVNEEQYTRRKATIRVQIKTASQGAEQLQSSGKILAECRSPGGRALDTR